MKQLLLVIGLLISAACYSQDAKTSDLMSKVRSFDFSDLLTADSILVENERFIDRKQPLGFIGTNFQRINIRFISVINNPENGSEYFVFGKNRVKDNICDFQGIIKITDFKIFADGAYLPLKQGYISGEYSFFEDAGQKHTGFFKGRFKTLFYLDTKGKLHYDALSWKSDEFKNNQFEGTWTSYLSGETKKCNWGDYRIPDSRNLDVGAAEFSPAQQFDEEGWKYYTLSRNDSLNRPDVKEAREKETEKWWIEPCRK